MDCGNVATWMVLLLLVAVIILPIYLGVLAFLEHREEMRRIDAFHAGR